MEAGTRDEEGEGPIENGEDWGANTGGEGPEVLTRLDSLQSIAGDVLTSLEKDCTTVKHDKYKTVTRGEPSR